MASKLNIERYHIEEIAPGTHSSLLLEMDGPDGEEQAVIPVHTLKGREAGPVLLILAGVHGDEYEGVQTIIELIRELSVDDIAGTLVMVPVANVSAYRSFSRNTPVDGKNLAREFLGDKEGTYTERLAWHIRHTLIAKANFMLDLHSGGHYLNIPPLVGYLHVDNELGRQSKAAAEAFGMEIVWGHPAVDPGPTLIAATHHGVPWIYTEAYGALRIRKEEQKRFKAGALRLMKHLGMLREETVKRIQWESYKIKHLLYGMGNFDKSVQAGYDGFFITSHDVLDEVQSGDIIGTIYDWFGNALENVRAYKSGVLIGLKGTPVVQKGEGLFLITERLSSRED